MWKVRAFNAQGSRVLIGVVCTSGAVKIYVAVVEALTKYRMKLSLPSKLVENLVWVPVILLCKIFILSYMFDVLLC
jgi:predicted proteasome-type protease